MNFALSLAAVQIVLYFTVILQPPPLFQSTFFGVPRVILGHEDYIWDVIHPSIVRTGLTFQLK
jgi:hypothetical protein